ncbi:hypothetical protein [Paraburkholderia humisilvae]|uniref:hypothetical protein n=1 Tax=Paraburkholderia humisilvae TaxID=627669 RepID=UPI001FE2DC87|nr:hypothetical protein [Paraburkholderia humisilvae]
MRNVSGAAIFSPVESIAKWVSPMSMPTCLFAFFFGYTPSSHRIETWNQPAVSMDTVTVVGFTPFSHVRDRRIAGGASIFASFREERSHLKALAVYPADWTPSLRRKVWILRLLLEKKLAMRCASAAAPAAQARSTLHSVMHVRGASRAP